MLCSPINSVRNNSSLSPWWMTKKWMTTYMCFPTFYLWRIKERRKRICPRDAHMMCMSTSRVVCWEEEFKWNYAILLRKRTHKDIYGYDAPGECKYLEGFKEKVFQVAHSAPASFILHLVVFMCLTTSLLIVFHSFIINCNNFNGKKKDY